MPRVVVTGVGVFTCFGRGVEALKTQVFAGTPGFRTVNRFDTATRRTSVAAVATSEQDLAETFDGVARDALEMAGFRRPPSAAVCLGTQGAWDGLTNFWRERTKSADAAAIAGTHADRLAQRLGLGGDRRTVFTNACVSSANAIFHGAQLIHAGEEEIVLAGGGYLVEEEFFAKFDSGRAFARDGRMRPFSADRSGLLLGDGVAVLILENHESAKARGADCLAVVGGSALSADSYHVCRPHPEGLGLARAAIRAIQRAGLRPEDIDYVNGHGTATPVNDPAECLALRQVFGSRLPPMSSTKGSTGHCLEGAGAVEAVISTLALRYQEIPPTAGWTKQDEHCAVNLVTGGSRRSRLSNVLSLSLAFGGVDAALVFSKVSDA